MSRAKRLAEGYTPGFRHELKYYISQKDYALVHLKLQRAMERDRFAKATGGEYHIRSLYFDDYRDSALSTKLAGSDERAKYRIRIYNLRDDVIKLECKEKKGNYIHKSSLSLSRYECESLLGGDRRFLLGRPEPFARRMYMAFLGGLRPVVIVDYVREPFVFPLEDVRVTFDKDIRTGFRSTDLFNPAIPTYAAIPEYDMVMEVKYNRYLSSYVRSLLQCGAALQSAISKYCMCRRYGP